MIKDGKKVQTVMKDFTIAEISAVDRPAQAHARMTIMKREDPNLGDPAIVKTDANVALTTMTAGHTHLIVMGRGEMKLRAGQTDYIDGHSHPWLMTEGGEIVVGAADGHNHGVEVISKADEGDPPASESDDDKAGLAAEDSAIPSEESMSDTDKAAAEAAEQQKQEIAKLTKRAERAEKIAELSNDQRDFFKSLKTEDQDAFLAKSDDERNADVRAAQEENKVVYKSTDGTEFRKNDDPRLVEMAKRMDDERKKRMESDAKAKKADLEKRAADLTNIPDKDGARVALLKAIDSLPEEEQKAALTALKAHNERLGKSFRTLGTSAAPSPDQDKGDELDVMAKQIQERDNITFEQAYAKALETPEGQALYAQTLEETETTR